LSLTYTKTYATKKNNGASAARALLPNLKMLASLSCAVLKKYY
jgi:hypothetical protein